MNKYQKSWNILKNDLKYVNSVYCKTPIEKRSKSIDDIQELVDKETPPTSEEVCKALSEMEGITEVSYTLKHSHYEGDTMDFLMFRGRYGFYLSELRLSDLIKYPNVLKIVSRFYEGKVGD